MLPYAETLIPRRKKLTGGSIPAPFYIIFLISENLSWTGVTKNSKTSEIYGIDAFSAQGTYLHGQTREHVVPQWAQGRYDLWNQEIFLLNHGRNNRIHVQETVGKSTTRRSGNERWVPMTKHLVNWLQPYAERKGRIVPVLWFSLRRGVSTDKSGKAIKEISPQEAAQWLE
jgi:hypothetical protein